MNKHSELLTLKNSRDRQPTKTSGRDPVLGKVELRLQHKVALESDSSRGSDQQLAVASSITYCHLVTSGLL